MVEINNLCLTYSSALFISAEIFEWKHHNPYKNWKYQEKSNIIWNNKLSCSQVPYFPLVERYYTAAGCCRRQQKTLPGPHRAGKLVPSALLMKNLEISHARPRGNVARRFYGASVCQRCAIKHNTPTQSQAEREKEMMLFFNMPRISPVPLFVLRASSTRNASLLTAVCTRMSRPPLKRKTSSRPSAGCGDKKSAHRLKYLLFVGAHPHAAKKSS